MPISIALLDDELGIRALARDIFLRAAPSIDFRTFDRGDTLLGEIDRGYAPAIFLIDYLLDDMKAIDILRRLEPMQAAGASIYIFTGNEDAVDEETRSRADGIISKSAAVLTLASTVLGMEEGRQEKVVKAGTGINALAVLQERVVQLRAALREGRTCPQDST
jgi:DNA-binding NarL/FixJ family response regulator